jgi:hypothetical protein
LAKINIRHGQVSKAESAFVRSCSRQGLTLTSVLKFGRSSVLVLFTQCQAFPGVSAPLPLLRTSGLWCSSIAMANAAQVASPVIKTPQYFLLVAHCSYLSEQKFSALIG